MPVSENAGTNDVVSRASVTTIPTLPRASIRSSSSTVAQEAPSSDHGDDGHNHNLAYPDWIASMPDDETQATIHFTDNLLPPLPSLTYPLLKAGVKGKAVFFGMSQWPDDVLKEYLQALKKSDGTSLTDVEIFMVLMRFKGRLPS